MARSRVVAAQLAARSFIGNLPEAVRERIKGVRLCIMEQPTAELIADGVEPDEAGAYIQRGEDPMAFFEEDDQPERAIYLFLGNMHPLDRVTLESVLLHEIGHAAGLGELEVSQMMAEVKAAS